jgi:hypothetical protein
VFALLATICVVLSGITTMVVSIRWIAKTNGAPWTSSYRRGHMDQRWAAPIGIGIDTVYIAAGVVEGADVAYWVGLAAIVAVQATMVALILVVVHRGNSRRRTTR